MAEKPVSPFPGQVMRKVHNWGDSSSDMPMDKIRPTVAGPEDADLITSEVIHPSGGLVAGTHKPVLDIDFPVKVVPSSTEGHFHLFIDREMDWDTYVDLLVALQDAGILEEGYVHASIDRGFTGVRPPWSKKPTELTCANCGKHPEDIPEYQMMAKGEDLTPTEFVRQEEGTLNKATGLFWCTECYIKLGQPLGKAR